MSNTTERPRVGEWVKVSYGKGSRTYEFEGEVVGVSPTLPEVTVQCECCGLAQPWPEKYIERVTHGTKVQKGC